MPYSCTQQCVHYNLFHSCCSFINNLLCSSTSFRQSIDILKQGLFHRNSVSFLILGVFCKVLLLTIVSQMNLIVQRVSRINTRGSPHIRSIKIVHLEIRCNKHPNPNVEFSSIIK